MSESAIQHSSSWVNIQNDTGCKVPISENPLKWAFFKQESELKKKSALFGSSRWMIVHSWLIQKKDALPKRTVMMEKQRFLISQLALTLCLILLTYKWTQTNKTKTFQCPFKGNGCSLEPCNIFILVLNRSATLSGCPTAKFHSKTRYTLCEKKCHLLE